MPRTKSSAEFRPGDWVLIDFAHPSREYFQPNAFGKVLSQIPVGNPWFVLGFVFLVDGEYREDHAPGCALMKYSPSEMEIVLWETSRLTSRNLA